MNGKSFEYYMSLPYKVEVIPEDDGSGFTAIVPELPGCMTCADTIEELWEMITEAKQLWIEVALEDAGHIPEPAPIEDEQYSGRFVVRLPRSLHRQLAQRAKWDDTSLNTLVVALLSDGMGRWGAQLVVSESKPVQADQWATELEVVSGVVVGPGVVDFTAPGLWTTALISAQLFDAGITLVSATDESAGSHEEESVPAQYRLGTGKRMEAGHASVKYEAKRMLS